MSQTVIGIFNDPNAAQNAVDNLLSNGFSESNVDVSSGRSTDYSTRSDNNGNGYEHESGVSRFFRNLFGNDKDESDRYTRAAERGSVVTVHAQSSEEAQRASTLLDQYGAIDVNDDNNYNDDNDYDDNYRLADTDTNAERKDYNEGNDYNERNDYNDGKQRTIPVIEENLQVGKKEVETGGVRLRSRIVEKPVEESLRLREEHVRVERNPVDRPATDADFDKFEEESIEITERAEVPVVSKEARVVEEVSLGKDVEHREETIHDTVRKTEVDVEDLENGKKNKRKK